MVKDLHAFFEMGLAEAYYIENELVEILEKLRDTSNDSEVKKAFEAHRGETAEQVRRIEEIYKILGKSPKAMKSEVLQGLVADNRAFMKKKPDADIVTLHHLGAAVKTERFEISLYEMLIRLSKELELSDITGLLSRNLKEEEGALYKVQNLIKSADLSDLYEE